MTDKLPCGCGDHGRVLCAEAERLWTEHIRTPFNTGHIQEQRTTLVAYWRHIWPEVAEGEHERTARELVR
ncbi:MAG: hypothetical protein V2A73_08705 [Pseudomonadota bacterium]